MSRSTDLYALSVKLDLQSAAFQKGVAQANKSIDRMDRRFKKTGRTIGNFAKGLAAAFTVRAVANFAKASIDAADNIDKMSKALGLSAKAYQELAVVADLSGVSQTQFTSNMTAFVKRVGEAANGMGPLTTGLKGWNQELLDSIVATDNQEDAFALLADAIKNAATETEAAAIANAAFGRSGITMVNMLREGKVGIDKLREGVSSLDKAQIDAAVTMKDKFTVAMHNFTVAAQELALKALPAISKAAKFVADNIDIMMKAAAAFLAVFAVAKLVAIANGLIALATAARSAAVGVGAITVAATAATGALGRMAVAAKLAMVARAGIVAVPVAAAAIGYNEVQKALEKQSKNLTDIEKKTVIYSAALKTQTTKLAEYNEQMNALPDAVKQNTEQMSVWNAQREELESGVKSLVDEYKGLYDVVGGSTANTSTIPVISTPDIPKVEVPEAVASSGGGGGGGGMKKLAEDIDLVAEATANATAEIKIMGDQLNEWHRIGSNAINDFASGFSRTLVDGIMDGKFAFQEFAHSFLRNIAEMILKQLVLNALTAAFGGGGPTNVLASAFAGGFASGGKIPSGSYGLVGERGPELVKGPAAVTSTSETAAAMQPQNIRIINVQPESAEDYLGSDPGERKVMNILRRNRSAVQGLVA